jgi:hypothetical protein
MSYDNGEVRATYTMEEALDENRRARTQFTALSICHRRRPDRDHEEAGGERYEYLWHTTNEPTPRYRGNPRRRNKTHSEATRQYKRRISARIPVDIKILKT